MNQETENKQCPICKGYLFEDDDVVVCPVCGAPHHRDCWQTVGHCGLETDHGTDRQYDKAAAKAEEAAEKERSESRECAYCGRLSNSHDGNFCPYCGQAYDNGRPHSQRGNAPHVFVGGMPFNENSYGGIPKDSKIEDVKVEHIGKFVGSNAHRYVPRFAALNKHSKGSWNWAAFLSPEAWCFSRKMYFQGAVFLILAIAAGLCAYPLEVELAQFLSEQGTTASYGTYNLLMNNIGEFSLLSIIMAVVSTVLSLVPKIICGRMGDWMYRSFTLDSVRKITSDGEVEDLDATLLSKGNVSLWLAALILFVSSYLPQLIASMLW